MGKEVKRALRIEGLDKELVLSIVTKVNITKKMINLEELEDGTWRLIYSSSIIPDISKVSGFTIVREE